jgi:pre-mRNA-processing factor 40
MNGINGLNGHAAPPGLWQEAYNNGRVYYYNTITKATQWTKPEELMTPAEVSSHVFREYTPLNISL